jgi:SAM-dependent methyltransferase
MRDEIWAAHAWMQTVSAYPNGPLPAATVHVNRATRFLQSKHGVVLLIGPGAANEIVAVKKEFSPLTLDVLTLSADEVAPIRAAGHRCEIGDMHDMPFENGRFDLVFSNNVFEHCIAPHVALLEARRVLREGGTFYAIVPTFETAGGGCTPWHTYCLDEKHWRMLCQKAGLRVDRFEKTTETLEGGAVEHYYHMRAVAVTPPWPHDEILRRISELKR